MDMKDVENSLVMRACQGDKEAMRMLYEQDRQRIYGMAFHLTRHRQDAEDILQETFVRAFGAMRKEDLRQYPLFSTWLYRIGINCAFDLLRRKKTHPPSSQSDDFDAMPDPDVAGRPERRLEEEEIGERIRNSLERLSLKQRLIFSLRHDEGMRIRDIAATMECSEGSVKRQLFRGMARLRRELAGTKGG